jgi:hypothetical protein
MKQSRASITSLPLSPDEERKKRMIEYSIMMGIRVLCVFVCFGMALVGLGGWWIIIPAAGAVFLPYFAVVVGNAARSGGGTEPLHPATLRALPHGPSDDAAGPAPEDDQK